MTTDRMEKAVHFCEEYLSIDFTGDINNFNEVSNFLGKYLSQAKLEAVDISNDYLASKYGCLS